MNPIQSFNQLADEFLQKMIKTFPNENKLKVYYANFKLTKQISARKPMEFVMIPMLDYGKQIFTKDENFFKRKECVEAAESFSEKTGLVDMWDSTSPQVKDSIWQYIQSMFLLGMKALGREKELQELLVLVNGTRG